MKISELKAGTIFQTIFSQLSDVEYLKEINPIDLDMVLVNMYGDRVAVSKLRDNMDFYLRSVAIVLRGKWKGYESLWGVDVDLSVGSSVVSETDSNGKEGVVFKGEDVNKVSSFNDSDLIDDSGRSVNNDENRNSENKVKSLVENKSLNSMVRNLQIAGNINIIGLMVKDVVNEITLSIY